MIINMGPQHPSTHGVLRLMLELQGETVLRCKPIIGYLHTGMEKTGETLTYMQGGTNVTRMDYVSPFNNELVFSMATEKLLGIDDDIPERAVWIRMLLSELNRMSSHLLFLATNGMDLGAVSMMIYGWREREEVLRFFQKVTGLRMNHNFIRPGGVAADLPAGWRDDVLRLLELIPPRLDEYDTLMTGQPIWRERLQGVGVITAEEAIALGATGPILRSHRRRRGTSAATCRTCTTTSVDFDVIVGSYGDAFDRYAIRLNEVRESMKIVRQILDQMPPGDYRIQNKKVTPPPRARIDESMEALIHHFKIFTEGFKVPEGEVYVAIESPRGEIGCYIASRRLGQAVPDARARPELREHPVAAAHDARRPHRRRRRDHLQRRPRPRRRRSMSRLSDEQRRCIAREIIGRYPRPKSATDPAAAPRPGAGRLRHDDAMRHIAELVGVTPAEVYGTASFYEMFKFEPVGRYLINICGTMSCALLGAEELMHHAEQRLGIKAGGTTTDGMFSLHHAECQAACTEAPACRSTTATVTASRRSSSIS